MLILARKKNESVDIGDEIAVTVIDIDRGKVRLGIRAPREITVLRSELVEQNGLPPALRTEDGRREEVAVEEFYDDGITGGGTMG